MVDRLTRRFRRLLAEIVFCTNGGVPSNEVAGIQAQNDLTNENQIFFTKP